MAMKNRRYHYNSALSESHYGGADGEVKKLAKLV